MYSNDSVLQQLERKRNEMIIDQTEGVREMGSVRTVMQTKLQSLERERDDKLERLRSDYDHKISGEKRNHEDKIKEIERNLKRMEDMLPDLTRQIEKRQEELQKKEQEDLKKAA